VCIAVLAASLAPSPGQPYRPIGGVLGCLGLFTSVWFIWSAIRTPVSESANRIRLREKARRIAKKDPRLADEDFDDGGLIDINHVPQSYLLYLPGIDQHLAKRIVELRRSVGGFTARGDLEVTLDLEPGVIDRAEDLMFFRPLW
jgi:hypothetical protein